MRRWTSPTAADGRSLSLKPKPGQLLRNNAPGLFTPLRTEVIRSNPLAYLLEQLLSKFGAAESAWEKVKAAFKRDWDQTKHDFGGKQPDTDQDVDDTVKQAAGKQPIPPRGQPTYEEAEDAYRFGYGARSQYGKRFTKWDDKLESELEGDWQETYNDRQWKNYRNWIRQGWDYQQGREKRKAA